MMSVSHGVSDGSGQVLRTGPPGHRGDYELIDNSPAGYGGQAVVFRARLASDRLGADVHGADVALRQLVGAGPPVAKLAARDADLREVRHRSLARHLEVFEGPAPWALSCPGDDDCRLGYAAAVWVSGETLAKRAATAAAADILRWVGQLAEGLEHLHSKGVIHRDVQPANVIIDDHDTAVLIDWGLARPVDGTMTSQVLGAGGFVPPEVASGHRATTASDRWQLGMTAVAALLGQPQGRLSPAELRRRLLRRLRGQVGHPAATADHLLALVELDLERRPATWETRLRPSLRRPLMAAALTLALLGIVVGGGALARRDVESATTCGPSPHCLPFTVVDTMEGGVDVGLYVRSCYGDEPCEKRALAALGQTIWGRCRVSGKEVEGDPTWVQVPWRFVPGSVAPDGKAVADATGASDPASPEFGWSSARYLSPRAGVDDLPAC